MKMHKEPLIKQIGWTKDQEIVVGYWLDNQFHIPESINNNIETILSEDYMVCWWEAIDVLETMRATPNRE